MQITILYDGQMRWKHTDEATSITTVMDGKKAEGGLEEGPSPKELVLHGLAGCTGLDVVAILGKKKVAFERFSIDVSAEQNKTHPVIFKTIHIHYRFTGDPADRPHFERAIELSKNQFCGISAMLAQSAEITWELTISPK